RAERLAAAAELRRRLVAVAGAAGALLGVHLLRSGRHFRTALALVRALLAARQLPHHASLQDVLADGSAEHRIRELQLAGALALDGLDRDLHGLSLSLRSGVSSRRLGSRLGGSLAQAGRVRGILGAGALGRVLDDDVAAGRAGDGAGDQQQALLVVGGDDLQVLCGHALVAVMAGHLLAGEGAAGILAVTGRTMRTVRD